MVLCLGRCVAPSRLEFLKGGLPTARARRPDPATLIAAHRPPGHRLTTACPDLAAVRDHVRAFADMMMNLRGGDLEQLMNQVLADDLPQLHSFVIGLRGDLNAALTLSHSSGKVEGHVNRVKMLKRQMYGRANLDLLRKRVLLAD